MKFYEIEAKDVVSGTMMDFDSTVFAMAYALGDTYFNESTNIYYKVVGENYQPNTDNDAHFYM